MMRLAPQSDELFGLDNLPYGAYATEGGKLVLHDVTVTYEHHDGQTREWSPDPYRMGLAA